MDDLENLKLCQMPSQVMVSYPKCRETLNRVVRSGFIIKYFRRTEVLVSQGSISPEAELLMFLFIPT